MRWRRKHIIFILLILLPDALGTSCLYFAIEMPREMGA